MLYSPEEVVRLARRSLEIEDDPDEALPDFYLSSFQLYLSSCPSDTNFILELATKSGTGGRGFGTATCMEDYCWRDIVLGPEPTVPDGGKKRGFGSLWEYHVHCQDAEHLKGRNERCQKQGITAHQPPARPTPAHAPPPARTTLAPISSSASSSHSRSDLDSIANLLPSSLTSSLRQPPLGSSSHPSSRNLPSAAHTLGGQPIRSFQSSSPATAGPSRHPVPRASSGSPSRHLPPLSASSSMSSVKTEQTPSRSMMGGPAVHRGPGRDSSLSEINTNLPPRPSAVPQSKKDIKPTAQALARSSQGNHKTAPIWVLSDSDSDDDVKELSGDNVPDYMRKKTNHDTPYVVSDDEDEAINPPSSSRSVTSSLPSWADKLKKSLSKPGRQTLQRKAPLAGPSSAQPAQEKEKTNPAPSVSAPSGVQPPSPARTLSAILPSSSDAQVFPASTHKMPVHSHSAPVQMTVEEHKALLEAEAGEVLSAMTGHPSGFTTSTVKELNNRYSYLMKQPAEINRHSKTWTYTPAGSYLMTLYPQLKTYASKFAVDLAVRYWHKYAGRYSSDALLRAIRPKIPHLPEDFTLPEYSKTTGHQSSAGASASAITPSGGVVQSAHMTNNERKAKLQAEIDDVFAAYSRRIQTHGRNDAVVKALALRHNEVAALSARLSLRPHQFAYDPPSPELLAHYPQLIRYVEAFAAGHAQTLLDILGPGCVEECEAAARQRFNLPVTWRLPTMPGAYPFDSVGAGPSGVAGSSIFPDRKPLYTGAGLSVPGPLDVLSSLSSASRTSHLVPGDEGYDSDNELYAEYGREDPLKYGQDLKDYFQETVDGWQDDADIDGALKKLGLNTIEDKFADMTIRLMPHQCLGVAWMLEKEKDRKYKGGLLCDAMGLGKTVQMIATMVGNKSKDKKVKSTLVIAPLALLSQWKAEIESKTTPGLLRVAIHHGAGRARSIYQLKQYDVILTTYGTLTAELGNDDKIELAKKRKKKRPAAGLEDFVESDESSEEENIRRKEKGPLFKMKWWRVVLDEAHTIRNRKTRMAKASFELDAELRWALTGTLIVNTLDDLHTQLCFTGISPCREFAHYQNHIGKLQKRKPRLATKRAQAILRNCMMRRHKDSTLNGRKLLELPPKTSTVETIDFSPEERNIYDSIEKKMQLKFTNFLKRGDVLKHMSCILVMLLRLRQLCNHPWLLRRNPGDPLHPNDFTVSDQDIFANLEPPPAEDPEELNRAIKSMGQAWVDEVKQKLRTRREKLTNAAKRDEEAEKDNECAICFEMMEDEVVVNCKHTFCRGCISEIFTNAPRDEDEMTDDQAQRGARKCPMCRAIIEKEKVFAAGALLPPEQVKEEVGPSQPVDRNGKRSADEEDELEDEKPRIKRVSLGGSEKSRKGKEKATDDSDIDEQRNVLPSTKMKRLSLLVQEFLTEEDAKIIVFSQFVTFLDLVAAQLRHEGIAYELYVGSMDRHEREDAVRRFTAPIVNEGSPRIMLISLKCGGVGLNLTAASKVISLDLAWNTASEEQAFDRAHRIGQTKPVDVRRVVIDNTVEQRILQLQEAKKALADGAMGEGDGGKLGRLSVGDLIKLFNVDTEAMYRDED